MVTLLQISGRKMHEKCGMVSLQVHFSVHDLINVLHLWHLNLSIRKVWKNVWWSIQSIAIQPQSAYAQRNATVPSCGWIIPWEGKGQNSPSRPEFHLSLSYLPPSEPPSAQAHAAPSPAAQAMLCSLHQMKLDALLATAMSYTRPWAHAAPALGSLASCAGPPYEPDHMASQCRVRRCHK